MDGVVYYSFLWSLGMYGKRENGEPRFARLVVFGSFMFFEKLGLLYLRSV
jgi:hypothetical protein